MAEENRHRQDQCSSNADNKQYDPRLDFYSDKFDPVLALQTPGLKVPDSKAKRYDNLALYKSAEVKSNLQQQNTSKKQQVQEEPSGSGERRWLPHQLPIKTTAASTSKNLIKRMNKMQGPLALLKKCREERLRIKIWTRNDRGIRGFCLAYIVAFDKHWNLALEEVSEYWTRLKKLKVPALDSAPTIASRSRIKPPEVHVSPNKRNKKLENCKRYVKQLLMRGEHVVSIHIVNKDSEENKMSVDTNEKISEINK